MNAHECTTCHEEIPAGLAVIHSVNFQKVAYHRECWQLRAAVVSALLPTQRVAGDVREKVAA